MSDFSVRVSHHAFVHSVVQQLAAVRRQHGRCGADRRRRQHRRAAAQTTPLTVGSIVTVGIIGVAAAVADA
jgi:hypothetical protein